MALEYFLYRSSGRIESFEADCEEIIDVARSRNSELELTGFLHCEDGVFFQWLEGEPENLALVRASIEQDCRHSGLKFMMEGMIESRQFSDWAMFLSRRSDGSLLEWLAGRDIALRDPLLYGQNLLEFMLQVVRSTAQRSA